MNMKIYSLVLLSMVFSSIDCGGQITCRSNPTTDEHDLVVDDGDSFTITCDMGNQGNQQDHIDSCRFEHYEPLTENRGTNYPPDIECTYAESGSMTNCITEQRITGQVNQQSCSVTVSSSIPEDTGTWTAVVSTVSYFK